MPNRAELPQPPGATLSGPGNPLTAGHFPFRPNPPGRRARRAMPRRLRHRPH